MTFYETAGQIRLFLLLVCAGAAAGMAYDLVGCVRGRAGPILGALADVFWCAAAAALCFWTLFVSSAHQLRLFAPLSMALGAGIYALGVRRLAKGVFFLLSGRKRQPQRRNPSPEAEDKGGG